MLYQDELMPHVCLFPSGNDGRKDRRILKPHFAQGIVRCWGSSMRYLSHGGQKKEAGKQNGFVLPARLCDL